MNRTQPGNPTVEIKLLGPVELTIGRRAVALGRRKQRALLALLALNANRVVSTDRLLDALWGERPPPTAPVALYGLVSALRKLLEPEQAETLVTKAPGYMLQLPTEQTDVGRFQELAAEGRRALEADDPETAAARLGEALALWRGPPLHDVEHLPFAQAEIGRLEELRLAAVEDRIAADLARGRDGDLVPELEALVAENPLRERPRGQLMLALYRAGRQADALAVYRDTRTLLVDELGLEPSAELQAIEGAILRHDPSLSLRTTDAGAAQTEAGRTPPVLERAPLRTRRAKWIVVATAVLGGVAAISVLAVTGSGKAVRVSANGLGVIEHGKMVAAGSVGTSPSDVAIGADSVWTTNTDAHSVSRVDPQTGDLRQTIPVGSGPSGIAADNRAVWVANSLAGTVSRIDPRTNGVVQTIPVGSAPTGIALTRGSVWVTSKDDQTISQLDSRTGTLIARGPVGAAPAALAVGDGSLWVADEKRGVVFRVDPARRTIVDTINVGNDPVAVAVGAGSVWIANNLDGTVSRIDPSRDAIAATIPVGDGPRGIAVANDGVWVSNQFDGTLASIDPGSNRVTRVLRLGEQPQGLAAARGRLFAAVRSAGEAHRGGTLQVAGTPPVPSSFDVTNEQVIQTTLMTNDGLVGFRRVGGADGGQIVPDLALAVPEPTNGGRTYIFRLRANVRYSNGRVVQPRDFRKALERAVIIARDPIYYGSIVGATACAARPKRCDLSKGISTDDRTGTVTFHLAEPDPDFLYELALPYAFAVPSDTPARDVGRHPLPATGPYMFASLKSGVVTFVRNPRFREWSKAAQPDGYPDRIVISLSKSVSAAVRAVERGSRDAALDGVPLGLEHEVETQYASQVHANPRAGTTYVFLNTNVPPFDDVRVRRAVNFAADRAAGVRASFHGTGAEPTCQILPRGFPGFHAYCPYTLHPGASGTWTAPDLERARRLVAASGTQGDPVTVWVPDNHRGEASFAAAIFRSLGYRTRIKRLSDNAYYGPTGAIDPRRRAQAGLFSWFADFPAASNFITTFFSCRSPLNWSEYCDRHIDAQIRRALELQTTDPYLANRLWARIDREIVDKATVVPLFTLKEVDIVSGRVGNYQYNPQWGVLLDQLWIR
jgi:peptide/nickel transport system substrate-binding protein